MHTRNHAILFAPNLIYAVTNHRAHCSVPLRWRSESMRQRVTRFRPRNKLLLSNTLLQLILTLLSQNIKLIPLKVYRVLHYKPLKHIPKIRTTLPCLFNPPPTNHPRSDTLRRHNQPVLRRSDPSLLPWYHPPCLIPPTANTHTDRIKLVLLGSVFCV